MPKACSTAANFWRAGWAQPAEPYFGWIVGSPPGLPGGGMTGVFCAPGSGGGTCISGSTLCGGRMTPLERSSCWLGLSFGAGGDCPSVSDLGGGSRSVGVDWAQAAEPAAAMPSIAARLSIAAQPNMTMVGGVAASQTRGLLG